MDTNKGNKFIAIIHHTIGKIWAPFFVFIYFGGETDPHMHDLYMYKQLTNHSFR